MEKVEFFLSEKHVNNAYLVVTYEDGESETFFIKELLNTFDFRIFDSDEKRKLYNKE